MRSIRTRLTAARRFAKLAQSASEGLTARIAGWRCEVTDWIPRWRFGLVESRAFCVADHSRSHRRPRRLWFVLATIIAGLALATLTVTTNLRGAPRPPLARPTAPAVAAALPATGQHGPRTVHFDLLAKLLADDRRSNAGDWRQALDDPAANCRVATQNHSLLGQAAPDFTLRDHRGESWNLGQQLTHGLVVVVFYLGYSCNACVHHLCELSADVERFGQLGARIVAISADPPELTRQRFDSYGALVFAVLSDPDHAVARQFAALRLADASPAGDEPAPDEPLHATFIIDRRGEVRWATRGDVPFRDSMALLYELAWLDRSSPQVDRDEPPEGRRP
ncbi:MAG TPA: redoxin domain-containing protein [Pirellulales bacterium]|jgi:peroxiredoxin|nr:redoxin domain-containing protein [Pirellulales bacterium]